jgi:hypothetical protein
MKAFCCIPGTQGPGAWGSAASSLGPLDALFR